MRGILLICLRRLGRDLKLADGSNEDKDATGMPRSLMTIRSLPAARLTQRPVSRWSSRMLIFFMCTLCHKAVCSFKLAARVRSYESLCALRARQEIRCTFCCGPQPGGARRRAGICGVAAPRRCHHIACVAAPCVCPPGARAKMHTLFSDGPLASLGGHKVHKSVKFCIMAGTAMPRSHRGTGISPVNDRAVRVSAKIAQNEATDEHRAAKPQPN